MGADLGMHIMLRIASRLSFRKSLGVISHVASCKLFLGSTTLHGKSYYLVVMATNLDGFKRGLDKCLEEKAINCYMS